MGFFEIGYYVAVIVFWLVVGALVLCGIAALGRSGPQDTADTQAQRRQDRHRRKLGY